MTWGSFQHPIRRLIAGFRKVSDLRDWVSICTYCSKFWHVTALPSRCLSNLRAFGKLQTSTLCLPYFVRYFRKGFRKTSYMIIKQALGFDRTGTMSSIQLFFWAPRHENTTYRHKYTLHTRWVLCYVWYHSDDEMVFRLSLWNTHKDIYIYIYIMVIKPATNCPKDCQTIAPSLLLRLQSSPWHWTITDTWVLFITM